MLMTDQGEYALRRRDGNPFRDEVLDQLVGQSIPCRGVLHGSTFIMDHWKTTDKSKTDQDDSDGP